MAIGIGDRVLDPRLESERREGTVLDIRRNPACFMRVVVVRWQDGAEEELEEIEFGPLED